MRNIIKHLINSYNRRAETRWKPISTPLFDIANSYNRRAETRWKHVSGDD